MKKTVDEHFEAVAKSKDVFDLCAAMQDFERFMDRRKAEYYAKNPPPVCDNSDDE